MSGTIEEFDDDTDFALPSAPPAAPGGASADQMAQLQQMMAQMGGGGGGAPGGPSGGMPPQLAQMMSQMGGGGGAGGMGGGFPGGPADLPANPTLTAEEKRWTTLYPIYFDAKRPFRKGTRRVKLDEACLWPLSEDIADAAQRLRLLHAHEPRKTHPSDWENPGRVKVRLFDDDGKAVDAKIQSKQDLIKEVASMIQSQCGGKPAKAATKKEGAGEKTGKENNSKNSKDKSVPKRKTQRLLPHARIEAKSAPPLAQRYPVTSPAREVGMLNADLGGMLGGMEGMGPLGAMMGQMGLGGGDDDDEEGEGGAQEDKEDEKKKKDPLQNLSRRQRKKVIRIGR